jgi:hypothetical protein
MGPSTDPDKKYFDVAKPRTNSPVGAPPFKNVKRQMINVDDGQKPQEESQPKSSIEEDTATFDDTLIEPEEAFEPAESSNALSHPDLNAPDHIDIDDGKNSDSDKDDIQESKDSVPNTDEDVPFVNPLPGTIDEEINESDQNKEPLDGVDQKNTDANDVSQSDESAAPKETKLKEQKDPQEILKTEKAIDTPAPPLDRFVASDALPDPSQPANDDSDLDMQDPKIFDTKEYYVPIGNTHHGHGSLKMALAFGVLCAAIVIGGVLYYVLKISK